MRRERGRTNLGVSQAPPGLRPGVTAEGVVCGKQHSDSPFIDLDLGDIRTCTWPGGTPKPSGTLVTRLKGCVSCVHGINPQHEPAHSREKP